MICVFGHPDVPTLYLRCHLLHHILHITTQCLFSGHIGFSNEDREKVL